MGVDAIIMFRSLDGKVPNDVCLPEGYSYELPDKVYGYGEGIYEVNCDCERYYNIGYERGSWQRISQVLMGLFASENVADVSYEGDCSLDSPNRNIITPDHVLTLHAHYMKHAHRPYDRTFRVRDMTTRDDLPKAEDHG
jgi:hypothetical protein